MNRINSVNRVKSVNRVSSVNRVQAVCSAVLPPVLRLWWYYIYIFPSRKSLDTEKSRDEMSHSAFAVIFPCAIVAFTCHDNRPTLKELAIQCKFSGLSSKLGNWKLMNLIGNWFELMLHLAKFCVLVILMTLVIKIVHNTKNWASKCHNTNFKITLFKNKSLTPKITHSPCLQSLCQCQCIALLRYENNLPCKF